MGAQFKLDLFASDGGGPLLWLHFFLFFLGSEEVRSTNMLIGR